MATFLKGEILIGGDSSPLTSTTVLINAEEIRYIAPLAQHGTVEADPDRCRAYLKNGDQAVLYIPFGEFSAYVDRQVEQQLSPDDAVSVPGAATLLQEVIRIVDESPERTGALRDTLKKWIRAKTR